MNGPTQKCPNDPARSRGGDRRALDLGYLPGHARLEVGAGDGGRPPQQDAGGLGGHQVVTLRH